MNIKEIYKQALNKLEEARQNSSKGSSDYAYDRYDPKYNLHEQPKITFVE
ncbi:hypothetical protein MYO4S_00229 [Serratia phage 4S]|nr:hypothetical protein MYO4S_00229 [Serratia phage 4S]